MGFCLYFKPEWTVYQHVFIACTGLKLFKYETLFSIRLQKNIDCSMLVLMYFRFRGTKQLLHETIFLLKGSKRKPHYPESFRSSQPIRLNSLNCLCNVSLLEILTVLHYKVNKGKKN